jgi:hypothetical protein
MQNILQNILIVLAVITVGIIVAAITNRAKDRISQAKKIHSSKDVRVLSFSIEEEFKKTGTG